MSNKGPNEQIKINQYTAMAARNAIEKGGLERRLEGRKGRESAWEKCKVNN